MDSLKIYFYKYLSAFLILLLAGIPMVCHCQLSRKTVRALQKGTIKEDSSFVYWLPFKTGTKQLMVQGYYTSHSHRNLIANDFKMKTGTPICAARAGVVTAVMKESNTGGLKDIGNHWNYIIIQHADGSTAIYGHLQQNGALVQHGDSILQGQEIGLSGNTGYSAFPHLHFQVWDRQGNQIPVRFLTKKGAACLKQMKFYRAVQPE
jgi:hypothetical protein